VLGQQLYGQQQHLYGYPPSAAATAAATAADQLYGLEQKQQQQQQLLGLMGAAAARDPYTAAAVYQVCVCYTRVIHLIVTC
jgi:hypothetical protein